MPSSGPSASEEAGVTPPMPGGSTGRIAKRGAPMASHTVLLIAAGASVLVVLSVVGTVYLLREPAKPVAAPITATPNIIKPAASTPAVESAPSLSPIIYLPVAASTPATPPPVVEAAPLPAPVVTPPAPPPVVPTPPVATAPLPVSNPAPANAGTNAKPSEAILLYIDQLRVMGVRSSGNDSKVLMNDRVYRVNDIVERTLGLRLTAVEAGTLTFVDALGATYIKNF